MPAVVERPAADHAGEPALAARLAARVRSSSDGDAAGGDHRDRHAPRQRARSPSTFGPPSTPSRSMSVKMIAATPASSKRRARSRRRRPIVSAQPSTATLPSRASMPTAIRPGKAPARLAHQRRIAQRRGAEDDARDAAVEPGLDRSPGADAAAELHRDRDGGEDRLDRRAVDRLAGERAVEIDDVQPARSRPRRRRRACSAGSSLKTVAWPMSPWRRRTHRPSFRSMAGKRIMAATPRKLAISRKPGAWLFSGWNCVPTMLSRPTTADHRAAVIDASPARRRRRPERKRRSGRSRRAHPPRCRRAADDPAGGPSDRSSPCAGSSARDRRASSRTTSPSIQPRPACSPCSRPTVGHAAACRRRCRETAGRASITARVSASTMPGNARASPAPQSANAPTPGSTMCDGARDDGRIAGDHDALVQRRFARIARSKAFAAERRLPDP